MSKFFNYILEYADYTGGRGKSISYEEAEKLILAKCLDAYNYYRKGGYRIFRGKSRDNEYEYIEPSKSKRASANTENYYTLLFDHILPSWKGYPKRSQSIICSTKESSAYSYGNLFLVFPFNGSKLGVCPFVDLWNSFKNVESLPAINSMIGDLITIINKDIPGPTVKYSRWKLQDDPKMLEKFLNSIPDLLRTGFNLKTDMEVYHYLINNRYTSDYYKVLRYFTDKSNKSVTERLNELLSPSKNDILLKKIGDPLPGVQNEVWTDGNCVMVNLSQFGNDFKKFFNYVETGVI